MPNPWIKSYNKYFALVNTGDEQPMTTFADKYDYNTLYSSAAYYKGCLFLTQLGYLIGEENLDKTLKAYFDKWAFKHPKPMDFLRVAEKVSGLELDWYLTGFAQTTDVIDYAVKQVDNKTITLERIGIMPMPIDLVVNYTDGSSENFHIPLREMLGVKSTSATVKEDWAWSFPTYTFNASKAVQSVKIDPKGRMADISVKNNSWSK